MSSAAATWGVVGTRERATALDEDLLRAARDLLSGGPVCFKVSTRVSPELLPAWKPAWKRFLVTLCRRALDAPATHAMQLTVFTSWAGVLSECKTPDDQILVMPLNRSYSRDKLDVTIECRPKDPSDKLRYETLRSVFAGYGEVPPDVREQAERLIEKCRRV